ncbi:MAG: hypothetical protein AABX98_00045 [Nanoarchaeota archaeon]
MAAAKQAQPQAAQTKMSRDEQVGFHKGSLSTLAKEREEMIKILGIVEQLMQMHIKALKELGIDLEAQAKSAAQYAAAQPKRPTQQLDKLLK